MKRRNKQSRNRNLPTRADIRPHSGPTPSAFYPSRVDAVVVAGTHEHSGHLIWGENKAGLELQGRPLLQWVVDALLIASSIDRIFIVGPVAELSRVLPDRSSRVRLVPQVGQLISNAWTGFQASETDATQPGDADRPVLFLSCDLPLISPAAVDDFVARCAERDRSTPDLAALHTGVAEASSLVGFQSQDGRPGIDRPFVEMRAGRYRMANIYVARPLLMGHREMLEHGFSNRKAKKWIHVLRLAWGFFRQRGGWRGAWVVLRLQAACMAARRPGRMYRALRRKNTVEGLEAAGSLLLGGPFRLVVTPHGGLSIDIDDESDFRIIQERLPEWAPDSRHINGARLA
jgi:GTP:adenosylcobinamide-phosphate guanylyltransferase